MSAAELSKECEALGLRVLGPIAPDLGWRPGVIVRHSLTSKRLDPLRERSDLTLSPCGRYVSVELR